MKLTRLELENFRGAPNGAWSFIGPDGAPLDTIYITGPESSGKTSFLEAIVALKESVGAYDMPPLTRRLLRKGTTTGKVEGTWQLSADEVARAGLDDSAVTTTLDLGGEEPMKLADPGLRDLFQAYSHDPAQGKFEYFPAGRVLGNPNARIPRGAAQEGRLRLSQHPDKYAPCVRDLVDLALSDGIDALEKAADRGILLRSDRRDSLAPYRRDLAELAPRIRLGGVEKTEDGHDLFFERPDGTRLTTGELSSSEKQALLFATTFRRIGLSRSIVLIDQPEAHLHVEAQLRFVRALERFGVDNQLFLATGSPEVTRLATPQQTLVLGGVRNG